jgi:UDP-N-acetylmuramate--alanine ligase
MFGGATIIDDYAHHPTEIRATLAAARALAPKRVIVVFQPHTYTRTKTLLNEFAVCFGDADEVIITDIYAARERNTHGISSKDLVDKIKAERSSVHYIGSLEDATAFLSTRLRAGDLLLTMGAGDVHYVGEALLALSAQCPVPSA